MPPEGRRSGSRSRGRLPSLQRYDSAVTPTRIRSLGDGALSQLGAEVFLKGEDLWRQRLGPQLFELRIAGVPFGIPLVGEATGRDVADEVAHGGGHVEVVVAADPRQ